MQCPVVQLLVIMHMETYAFS